MSQNRGLSRTLHVGLLNIEQKSTLGDNILDIE